MFVRSPAQSDSSRGNVQDIRIPPPILDNEVFDGDDIDLRIREGQVYLSSFKSDGRHGTSHDDFMESKCDIPEVRIAAMASPQLRIAPQANANQIADLLMPLLLQEIREQFGAMQAELLGQLDAFRHETQQQFRILQYNMAALAFNSSALNPEAPIRPLMNDAALLPDRFPATLRDFHDPDEGMPRDCWPRTLG